MKSDMPESTSSTWKPAEKTRLYQVTRAVITISGSGRVGEGFQNIMDTGGFLMSGGPSDKQVEVKPPADNTKIVIETWDVYGQPHFRLFRVWPDKTRREIDSGYALSLADDPTGQSGQLTPITGRGSDGLLWDIDRTTIDPKVLDAPPPIQAPLKASPAPVETQTRKTPFRLPRPRPRMPRPPKPLKLTAPAPERIEPARKQLQPARPVVKADGLVNFSKKLAREVERLDLWTLFLLNYAEDTRIPEFNLLRRLAGHDPETVLKLAATLKAVAENAATVSRLMMEAAKGTNCKPVATFTC